MQKKYRLKKNTDFQKIIGLKKSVSCGSLVIYYDYTNLEYARVGISVSKKIGGAVIRNHYRRQIRTMADELIDFTKKCDYIIIVRNRYVNQSYEQNKVDFQKLLIKISIKEK